MEAEQKQLEMELAQGGGHAGNDGDGKPTTPVEVQPLLRA